MLQHSRWLLKLAPAFMLGMVIAASTTLPASAATTAKPETTSDDRQPVHITADEVVHDRELATISARGDVELTHGDRLLRADQVTFDQERNIVLATGNVALLEPGGDVLTAEYLELNGALKDGFILNLRAVLADGSRFAARRLTRKAGQSKVMDFGVYSPCNACPNNPERPPLWQIKALTVIHDEAAKDLIYKDAWLEFWGTPIAYVPFFFHPDPSVDRRTGLLPPRLGQTQQLGSIVGMPHYWALAPDRDLQIEPIIYSEAGGVLNARYRQHLGYGELDFAGTLGFLDDSENGFSTGDMSAKGSIDLSGRFSLDANWRAGFDLERSSNRTYLRRFKLDSATTLTSRIFAEGFFGNDYTSIGAYQFQGLEADDIGKNAPVAAPLFEYDFVSDEDRFGGYLLANTSVVALAGESEVTSNRLSQDIGYRLPYISAAGEIITLTAKVTNDAYQIDDYTTPSGALIDNETSVRSFPQLALEWRLPLVRRGPNYTQIIEPIVMAVAGPSDGNKAEIPNEDSQDFEFDETTLFRLNRFNGRDRVTTGSYIDYGVSMAVRGDGGRGSSFFIGQSQRIAGEPPFQDGSGLARRRSDYVGRITMAPSANINASYRFRLDQHTFTNRRNELGLVYNNAAFGVGVDYVLVNDATGQSDIDENEQVALSMRAQLSDFWSAKLRLVHDFSGGENNAREAVIGVNYGDECFTFGIDIEHTDVHDEEIEPDTSVLFRINFTNLGNLALNAQDGK